MDVIVYLVWGAVCLLVGAFFFVVRPPLRGNGLLVRAYRRSVVAMALVWVIGGVWMVLEALQALGVRLF